MIRDKSIVITGALAVPCSVAQQTAFPLPPDAVVDRDLRYVDHGHERQILDVYRPSGDATKRPLILVIHGGAWRTGDKASNVQVKWGVPKLLDAGFVVASVNHRYSSQALFPAQIQDVKAALRWLRTGASRFGINGHRVGVWGMSSGGHLAALLGTSAGIADLDAAPGLRQDNVRVQAVVDWFGPTEFSQMDAHRLPEGDVHNGAESPESQLVGRALPDIPQQVMRASPLSYVSADDPPFLIFHGDRDRQVPHHQSELLRDALERVRVPVTLRTLVGAGHGTAEFRTDSVAAEMVEFFRQHLGTPPQKH